MSGPACTQLLLTVLLSGFVAAAHAGPLTLLDPSARSAGMGGAAVAVPWGGPLDIWANPALVALPPGVSMALSEAKLLPDVVDDVRHHSATVSASVAGIGLASAGRPFGGNAVEEPAVHEDVESATFGISAAGLFGATCALLRLEAPDWADWVDVAYGRQWKRTHQDYYGLIFPAGNARDEGWLVRMAPFDSRRKRAPGSGGGTRVEVAVGHSILNERQGPQETNRMQRRMGVAARVTWRGHGSADAPEAPWAGGFQRALRPRVDLMATWDHERTSGSEGYPPAPLFDQGSHEVEHYGLELALAGVLAGRFGYVDDREGRITLPTWGAGVMLSVGSSAEVGYDIASVPQSYPRRVWRHVVAFRADPIGRWLLSRERRAQAADR